MTTMELMSGMLPGSFVGMTEGEADALRRRVACVEGKGVEIGCMDGCSARLVLDASTMSLTSIDPLIPDSMDPKLQGDEGRLRVNMWPWRDRWELIRGYSWDVEMAWREPINYLYIDGDHRYPAVKVDFLAWAPHLWPGGILAMHDCRLFRTSNPAGYWGPSRVAQEHLFNKGRWEILEDEGCLLVARKVGSEI